MHDAAARQFDDIGPSSLKTRPSAISIKSRCSKATQAADTPATASARLHPNLRRTTPTASSKQQASWAHCQT